MCPWWKHIPQQNIASYNSHIASRVLNHVLLSFCLIRFVKRAPHRDHWTNLTVTMLAEHIRRKSQKTVQLKLHWCLLLTPCMPLWEISQRSVWDNWLLPVAELKPQRKADFWCHSRVFVLFLLLFDFALDGPSGWLFFTQHSWSN